MAPTLQTKYVFTITAHRAHRLKKGLNYQPNFDLD